MSHNENLELTTLDDFFVFFPSAPLLPSRGKGSTRAWRFALSLLPPPGTHPPISGMGGGLSLFGGRDVRLLVAGLDAAGKTTVLYKLKNGPKRAGTAVNTIPTLNFNVETCRMKNIKFSIWDVGGQDSIRPLWRHYFTGTQGLIYVVDTNDRARIKKAAEELHTMVANNEMRHACVLIFANKMDLPHSLDIDELTSEMQLQLLEGRPWHIQRSCATTGEGLWEGLRWMAANVKDL